MGGMLYSSGTSRSVSGWMHHITQQTSHETLTLYALICFPHFIPLGSPESHTATNRHIANTPHVAAWGTIDNPWQCLT
jgi:hypothetical protein